MTLLKGNLLTSVGVGVGTTQPECNGGGSFVVLGSQTCYAIHGPFRTLRPEEAKERLAISY